MKGLLIFLLLCGAANISAAELPFKEGFIPAGRMLVHYVIQGRGPAVMLLHGGFLDLHSWDHDAVVLSKSFTVVRIDLPGHGLTKGSDTTLSVIDVLRICLDSLQIKRASFIGLSLGGVSAIDFVLACPDRVNKLILVSTGITGWPEVITPDTMSRRLFKQADSIFARKDHQQVTDLFTHLWCDGPYREPAETPPAARKYVYETVWSNDKDGDLHWPAFNRRRAATRVGEIKCPVLILTGSLDVPLIRTVANYLHDHIAGSQITLITDSAHMINLEKPVLFDQYVEQFLRSS